MIRLPRPPVAELDARRLIPRAVVLAPDRAVRILPEFDEQSVEGHPSSGLARDPEEVPCLAA